MSVYLKVPLRDELFYRKIWLDDCLTMEYNSGYDLDISGYNYDDGTIVKSIDELNEWYDGWIDKEPDRYFAYIYDTEINEPVGEIYYYKCNDTYDMGVVISDKYRGRGYSTKALVELEKIAFLINGISELTDYIPEARTGAIKSFTKASFVVTDVDRVVKKFLIDERSVQLKITKEMFLESNK